MAEQWGIQIHSGYMCHKCDQQMDIMLCYKPTNTIFLFNGYFFQTELAYEKTPTMIGLAKKHGVLLETRYSAFLKKEYIMHVCPHCDTGQGDNYVVVDNQQINSTMMKESFVVEYDAEAELWDEIPLEEWRRRLNDGPAVRPVRLVVPIMEKDRALKLGAIWNPRDKSWFVPGGMDLKPFEQWLPPARAQSQAKELME
ncbi:DUF5710 domain-containing protein [Paenibacillus agricola]|uniref:DUF5710 domain-containing protein n=1 Tax=Paenibacillus agricola TaxID=2716264 RepID=A0ABX0J664_9BACL|nr:DUF5710 domain-containing protein [Paenibacillus agricola]NHN29295.1 hypothetical protein [Paenibacillus agricola]